MLSAAQAQHIARTGLSQLMAEVRYQVSPEMLRYRLNVTGATRRSWT